VKPAERRSALEGPLRLRQLILATARRDRTAFAAL
jgi:hypothetical protein